MRRDFEAVSRRAVLASLAAGFAAGGCGPQPVTGMVDVRAPYQVGDCTLRDATPDWLSTCRECCGPEQPRDAWNHACMHPRTRVYSCGRLWIPGMPNIHDHDPEEVALCQRLAAEAAELMAGVEINLSESTSALEPFFVAANRGEPTQHRLHAVAIRKALNGAAYPDATIETTEFAPNASLWEAFVYADDPEWLAKWNALREWFASQKELGKPRLATIDLDIDLAPRNFGCVFPRLVVAPTQGGSVVGLAGYAVHT